MLTGRRNKCACNLNNVEIGDKFEPIPELTLGHELPCMPLDFPDTIFM